jgi:hypothetical protein
MRTFPFLIFFALIASSSCKRKEKEVPNFYAMLGTYEFKSKATGQIGTDFFNIIAHDVNNDKINKEGQKFFDIYISLIDSNHTMPNPGTYLLFDKVGCGQGQFHEKWYGGDYDISYYTGLHHMYTPTHRDTGVCVITSVDKINRLVSGTFYFNTLNKPVHYATQMHTELTNGSFNNVPY